MTALLIVGHGTRDADGAEDFRSFVDRVRTRAASVRATAVAASRPAGMVGATTPAGPTDTAPPAAASALAVDGGFIELSAPPVGDAVTRLVEAGHRRLAAVPLVLVAAGHAKGDIPGSLNRERLRHPGLSFSYGRPLGVHPTILSLLEARLDTVLPREERADAAVLLVGRGSTDPDANAEVYRAARLFWEGRGIGVVEPAFVSLAQPSVTEGLERCRKLGAKRIVVLPYFLFRGVLPDRIVAEAEGYDVAPVIGDCDELADLVLERHAEAVAGDIRMNCDTCVYRIAMPGFEHKVGAVQAPHHHPDEDGHGHGHDHAHGHGHAHAHG